MAKALESIKEFATIAFTLLGVLFGMVIMAFIFGQLGPTAIGLDDNTLTVTNESGGFINLTSYTISVASNTDFNGGFAVINAYNNTDGILIPSANYTIDATLGTITNATVVVYNDVNLTYTYNSKTVGTLGVEAIQNNSLIAIETYSDGASTQFNTLSITIILILLIAVFLIFWRIFVSSKNKKGERPGGNFE